MAAFFNDTFTEASKTAITSHTSDSGHTWSLWAGATPVPDVYTSLGGIVASGSASTQVIRASALAPAADVSVPASITIGSLTGDSYGILARMNAGGTAAYLVAWLPASSKWGIFRVGSGLATTQLALQSGTTSYSVNDVLAAEFIVTGTGATVSLELKIGGVSILTAADAEGARIVDAGYIGLWFRGVGQPVATGMFFGSLQGADVVAGGTITITEPVNRKVNQRSAGVGTVSVGGAYTGAPASIEGRLVLDGTNTPVSGFDWATKVASPSGGTYAFTFTGVPEGGWYNVQTRHSDNTAINATSGKVAVGALYGVDGQSNAWLFFSPTASGGDSTLTADARLAIAGIQPTAWDVPSSATMNGAIALGNALVAGLGVPVGLIDGTWSGSGLTVSGNGGQWISGGAAGNAYAASAAAIAAETTSLEGMVWIHGVTDAESAVSQSAYYTALGQLISLRRTDVGNANLPYVVATQARKTTGTNDANWQNIKKAQIQKCGDANIYRVDRMDLALSDGTHHTAAALTTLGQRIARALLAAKGLVSTYRGPRISAVRKVSATVFDVLLTHDMGADFTPSSGITGFRVLDGGTPATISSVARQSATSARITLSATPTNQPVVQYFYGAAPTVTSPLLDNGALTLPLEANDGVTAEDFLEVGLLTNSQTFFAPTVTPGDVTLTPSLFTNSHTFYSPIVSLDGEQTLVVGLLTNTQTFYGPTVTQPSSSIARPSSDVSAGTWTPSTGTDLFAMIDEASADDADYISSTSAGTCSLGLNSVTDPLASTGHVFKYRAWAPTTGGLVVKLKQGTTVIATWTHATLPTSPTTYTQTLSGAEADSITDYTALRVDFEATV